MAEFKLSKLFAGDKNLWIIYAFLAVISIIEVYSATTSMGIEKKSLYYPIIGHVFIIFVSVVLMVCETHLLSQKYIVKWLTLPYVLGFVLLFYVLFFGVSLNGATRWFRLGGFSIQPSEIIKIGMISVGAFLMARMNSKRRPNVGDKTDPQQILKEMEYDRERRKSTIIYYLLMGLPILLIFPQNFSTAVLLGLFTICFAMVGMAHGKVTFYVVIGSCVLGVVLALALLTLPKDTLRPFGRAAVWKDRLESKFHKPKDENVDSLKFVINDDNMQEQHARIAVASGASFGVGAGQSMERFILPQAYADYIYAIIIEEWGLIGLFGIPIIYIWLYARLDFLARRTSHRYYKLLLYGIGMMFVMQAVVNMAVATGAFVTGQTLPLISRGGSSYIMTSLSFGVALSVSYIIQKQNRAKERLEKGGDLSREDREFVKDEEEILDMADPFGHGRPVKKDELATPDSDSKSISPEHEGFEESDGEVNA